MRYTEPRFTKDLDLWVEASEQNAPRVFRALAEFGAPLREFGRMILPSPISSIS